MAARQGRGPSQLSSRQRSDQPAPSQVSSPAERLQLIDGAAGGERTGPNHLGPDGVGANDREAEDPATRGKIEDPGLTAELDAALAADHPLAFLMSASAFAEALDPRRGPAFEDVTRIRALSDDAGAPGHAELPELPELLSMFIESGEHSTQALAYAVSRLRGDDLLRARVDRQLGNAVHGLPRWLQLLGGAQPTETLEAVDPVLAGTNLAVGVRLACGRDLTIVGFVDFDLGSALTDAYVLDTSPAEYSTVWKQLGGEVDQLPTPPADVRAQLLAAIDASDHTVPPYETDTWPHCRALMEWAIGMLPSGGNDFADRTLTPSQQEAVVADFLASDEAADYRGDPDTAELAGAQLDFRQPQNDPLLWSGKAVELFLCDYAARKFLAPRDYLAKFPDVLARLIRYGHRLRGVSQDCTDEALEAVTRFRPEFDDLIADRGRPGSDVLGLGAQSVLELLGAEDPDDVDWANLDLDTVISDPQARIQQFQTQFAARMLDSLAAKVGGQDALQQVDTAPLPPEPLSLDGVAEDIAERIAEISRYADDACNVVLDAEMKMVTRRLLHDVAVADPSIFRRRARTDTAAAAICWIALINNNGDPAFHRTQVPVNALLSHFGVRSASQRAKPMLAALGLSPHSSSPFDLGNSRYLTSTTRAEIISARDRYGDA